MIGCHGSFLGWSFKSCVCSASRIRTTYTRRMYLRLVFFLHACVSAGVDRTRIFFEGVSHFLHSLIACPLSLYRKGVSRQVAKSASQAVNHMPLNVRQHTGDKYVA